MAKPLHPLDRRNPWIVIDKKRAKLLREDHGFKKTRATRSDKGKKRTKRFY